jgi:hypothetical protein
MAACRLEGVFLIEDSPIACWLPVHYTDRSHQNGWGFMKRFDLPVFVKRQHPTANGSGGVNTDLRQLGRNRADFPFPAASRVGYPVG